MPISVTCDACGKTLKAPDTSAGKKAKCPGCSTVIQVPDLVYDAEEIQAESSTEDAEDYEDEGEATDDNPFAGMDTGAPKNGARRPCPACGEMIMSNAVKCRFCGEVLNSAVGKSLRGKTREKTNLDRGDKELLTKFRRAMHGLGGFCSFIAVVCLAVTIFVPAQLVDEESRIGAILVFGILSGTWLVLGIFCFKKHLWAAYALGVLCTLSGISNLASGKVGPGAFSVVLIWAAFSAAANGRELRRRGVSLTKVP